MVNTEALVEPSFKVPNDPRHTWIGRRLRRLSLDETPQLWNVLHGEMSLVGPRPEEEAVVALYDERQRLRLGVKPGITGPMQVYGRGDLTFEERLALELAYIDNLSIAQDVSDPPADAPRGNWRKRRLLIRQAASSWRSSATARRSCFEAACGRSKRRSTASHVKSLWWTAAAPTRLRIWSPGIFHGSS